MAAGPLALLKRLLAFLCMLAWSAWNWLASLNDSDWLAVATNRERSTSERLFNTSVQSEPLSLPWTVELVQVAGEDALEFVCTYNSRPGSGLSDIQVDRIGLLRSVGVADFYSGCLDSWPAFLRDSGHRLTLLDWSERSGSGLVVARLAEATAGLAYTPQAYPLVVFAFGTCCVDGGDEGGGRFRCCLAAIVHLPLAAGQPPAQILRRFYLRWRPEDEEATTAAATAVWRPRLLELRPYYDCDSGGGCVVCQSAPAGVLLLPCRHACLCAGCAARLPSDLCPVCRRLVQSRVALGGAAAAEEAPA